MPDRVTQWLEQLGLGEYASSFSENHINTQHLVDLTGEDLRELGVSSLGHRKTILSAIKALDLEALDVSITPAGRGEAERRQLTVMFCDLVGSTELSQKLDPEDLRAINRAYQDACKDAIERYEGYVARYMGDGVLAYFGYPQAHEDDAERAIHAGLGVVEAVSNLSTDQPDIELGVRVGIATGPVVVGDLIGEGASQESAVVGETPNLAARLQGHAETNTVVISPGTHEIAGGRFEYEHLGEHPLKGIAEPVGVWRAIAPVSAESRFDVTRRASLTPLVGREHEIGLLLDRWSQAKEGDGQVVLLSGEAGIGKSRITETLQERIATDEPIRLRYQCSPYYANSALYPIISQLERAARFDAKDSTDNKLDKLESLLGPNDTESVVPLFAALLSVPLDGRYPAIEMPAERQREATLNALVSQMEATANNGPVLVLFEDAHWADPTSLDLLELVLSRVQRLPVLAVITFRPEFAPPWTDFAHGTSLALNRFARGLSGQMIGRITDGKSLPTEVVQQIIEKTDGVPLFVEELTKSILESGELIKESDRYVLSGPLSDTTIPSTLHDSLMARLDRLGPVKEVAQAASVIGREFEAGLLKAIVPLDESVLNTALDELINSGLTLRVGGVAEQRYTFKHALVQNAAYESLLKSKRQSRHKRVAETLESQAGTEETQPELLAHHYTEANIPDKAIEYWLKAGQRTALRSADKEAVVSLRRALAIVETLPKSNERARQELELYLALIGPLMMTTGYASSESWETYKRMRELCEQLGETDKLVNVLFGEYAAKMMEANYHEARDIATRILPISNDPGSHQGHVGWASLMLGDLADADRYFGAGLKLYESHNEVRFAMGVDPKATLRAGKAFIQWLGGLPEQSLANSTDSISSARELEHAGNLGWALTFPGTMLAYMRRDVKATERFSAEAATFSEYAFYGEWATEFASWASGKQGHPRESLPQMRRAVEDLSVKFLRTIHLAALVDICIDANDLDAARRALDEALLIVEEQDERVWEAEIHRLVGQFQLAATPEQSKFAEDGYRQAIATAENQGSKSLELRAATSLAQLWRDQGKRGQARDLLAPIYTWFTEGFDTADLKEAKALLAELS